jgi:hypothetical protein
MKITPKKVGALSAVLVTTGLIGMSGVAGASSCNWNNNRYCNNNWNNNYNNCNRRSHYNDGRWNSYSYGYNNYSNSYWW